MTDISSSGTKIVRYTNSETGLVILSNKLRDFHVDDGNTITSQMDSTNNLTLEDSIHAQKEDQLTNLLLYHVGVICSAYSGKEEELEEIIKFSLVKYNINYIKIGRFFYNGNNFVVVILSSEKDRNTLLEITDDESSKFISCLKLDKTLGKR